MQAGSDRPITRVVKRLGTWVVLFSALLAAAWLTAAVAKQPSGSPADSYSGGQQSAGQPTGGAPGTTGPTGATGPEAANPQGTANAGDAPGSTQPQYGATVRVDQSSGTVTVTLPGTSQAVPLGDVSDLPVGATIDATHGRVTLVSAVGASGNTQSATFWGGKFSIRQPKQAGGYTEIVLPKVRHASCPSRAGAATISRRRRPPVHLWAQDHHGRYRTRGKNSVATVRGTRWLTVERCDGTLTHVARGAVSVRDLHRHRSVLVKAHHSYLAQR